MKKNFEKRRKYGIIYQTHIMIIIIGLGNPGEKFKNTRHNAGFMAVDLFAKKNNFPDFQISKKYLALISEKGNGAKKIILAKPQTFMNESGKAAKKIISESKKAVVVIVHDDTDLPLGKLKIAVERGSAGHKGVESVIKNISNKGLIRFRVGTKPQIASKKNAEDFVIKNFTDKEQKAFAPSIKRIAEALDYFCQNGLEKTMNRYNRNE